MTAVALTERREGQARPPEQNIAVMVRIEDASAHCEHARGHGAGILTEPRDYPYGERQYAAEDLAGYRWDFTQSIADVPPEAWGGTTASHDAGTAG